jgi:outer membrane biosynthesis protein TonB
MKSAPLVLAGILLATHAMAAPADPLSAIYQWLYPPKSSTSAQIQKSPPVAPKPLPAPERRAKPETQPAPAPESRPAPPKVQSRSIERPKPKPKQVQEAPKPEPLSCADVRRGVGMPCFLIRANSHHYERLSPAQKRQADSCLSASERAAIKACFTP